MTMITPSYLGETIEYSSLHACRSTLEDPNQDGLLHLIGSPQRFFAELLARASLAATNPAASMDACIRLASSTSRSFP